MTSSGTRSLWGALVAAVVVGFTASLLGCASLGPVTPVAVSDVRSVAGIWQGVVYKSNSQPDYVDLTIREDGSYEVVSRHTIGKSNGKGRIVVSDGRLLFQGEKGHGVGTLLRNRAGDRLMEIEATLSDNSTLSATLSLSR